MGTKGKSRGRKRKGDGKAAELLRRLWSNKLNAVEFALASAALASVLLAKPVPTSATLEAIENLLSRWTHIITATVLTALGSLVAAAVIWFVLGSYMKSVGNRLLPSRQ